MSHSKTTIAVNNALHSSRGFSAQPRIMPCGGSVHMSEGIENETNPAAELGTAVHELTEVAMKFGLSCYDFIGLKFNKIVMTEEDAEAGQVYVNYYRQLKIQYPNMKFYIEQKVRMSSISDELWGTSDLIGVDISIGLMIVLDYKNGWGIVEIDHDQLITGYGKLNGSAQCVGYALAAMDTLQLWGKIKTVITGIVQPNVEHINGVIRLKEFNMAELTQWHQAYRVSHGRTDIVAGSHCTYCLASGTCAARIRRTLDMTFFNESIESLSDDQVFQILPELKTMKKTIERIEKQALNIARKGRTSKDYKLVKAIKWAECKDENVFIKDALEHAVHERFSDEAGGVTEEDIALFESEVKCELYGKPKLKGMTALKKLTFKGSKEKILPVKLVNEHFVKPEGGTVLVPISDKRAAIMADQRPSIAGTFTVVN